MQKNIYTKTLFIGLISCCLMVQTSLAQSFSSGTVNATIVDNNCDFEHSKASISVSGLAAAADASFGLQEACIRINHNYIGDVRVWLRSPNGTLVELSTNNGGSGDNYGSGTTYTCFRKTATTAITAGSAPFTAQANYRPEGDLGAFNNGQNPNGTWDIFVCDNSSGTGGTLVGGTLLFSATPAVPIVVLPTAGDCLGAVPICSNTYSAASAPANSGIYADINTNNPNLCLGTESKSAWYVFTAQNSGNFGFILTPSVSSDDYDWALFDLTGKTCTDIYTDPSTQVSCNAYGVAGNTGTTTAGGLGSANNGLYNNQGEGSSATCPPSAASGCTKYNAQIPVTAGRNYVLYISNFNGTGGYTLDFSQSTNGGVIDILAPAFQSVVTPIICGATTIRVRFSENVRCASVSATDFVLSGPSGNIPITGVSSQACIAGSAYGSQYDLTLGTPLTQSGNYSISLAAGASIQDNCSNTASNASLPFVLTIADASFSYASANACINTGGTLSPTLTGSGGTFNATPAGLSIDANGLVNVAASNNGTYTVSRTVTQGACTDTRTAILNINANPSIALSGTSAFCVGGSTTLTASGANTYTWTGGINNAALNISTAGTYTVTATATSGCTATASSNVASNPLPTPSLSATSITCSTTNATLSANGGATYTFSANANSASGSTALANTVGNYTVTVTHSNGCTASTSVAVAQNTTPPAVTLVADGNITCTMPIANLTASNGTTYAWSANVASSSGATASASSANTYTVTATNSSNGCTASRTIAVTQNLSPPSISVSANPATLTCNTLSTSITVAGGNAYMWSGASILSGINAATVGLNAPGTYTVTVTQSSNGCTATSGVLVSQNTTPPTPSISAPATLTCSLLSTNITASGANTYAWSSNVSSSAGATASVNIPTTYIVTATGANGCTASTTVAVVQDISTPAAAASNSGNPCPSTVFSLSATPNGASSYAWSGANAYNSTLQNPTVSASATAAMMGTYTVTVTATNGCTATATTAASLLLAPTASTPIKACNVAGTFYTFRFNISGTPTPTVTDNAGIGGNISGGIFISNDIPVATLPTFTVSNICSSVLMIPPNTACTATADCSGTIGCFGANLAQNADFSNGFNGFTSNYIANFGGSGNCSPGSNNCNSNVVGHPYYASGTSDILCQGSFGIDANVRQCNKFWSPNITDHTTGTGKMMMVDFPATYNAANNRIWCQNITLDANTDYCFGAYFINLIPAGTGYTAPIFSFSVNGTPFTNTVSVGENEQWQSNGVQFHNNTAGSYNLCINNLNAGTNGYDVGIDDISIKQINTGTIPNTTNDIKVLCAGQSSTTINVLSNDLPGSGALVPSTLKITTTPAFSDGFISNINTTTGAITFTPYSTFYTTGGNTANFEYQICNTSGCCATASVTINAGTTPTATLTANGGNALCANTTKTISVSNTTGGSGSGYSYLWSNAAATASTSVAPTLSPSNYTVTVTDGAGCSTTASLALTINPLPTAQAGANNTICNTATSALLASATGGTAPYTTYTWSDAGANPHNIAPSVSTTYSVTVTDTNGCTSTATTRITVNPLPTASISGAASPICRNNSATLSATATGGSGTYTTYTWDNTLGNGSVKSVNPTSSTIYNVTISDTNGCSQTANTTVTVRALPLPEAGVDRAICAGGSTVLSASSTGGAGSYTYAWSGGLGNGASKTVSPASSTTYTVTVTDGAGCSSSTAVIITVNPVSSANLSSSSVQYCADRTATLTVTNVGTYLWSNGSTNSSIAVTPASATTYTVTVTDSNNCLSSASATVTPNSTPLPSVAPVSSAFCSGGSATISSAAAFSSYIWSNGSSNQSIAVTVGGIYTVTVTDGNGCTGTASRNVLQNPLPSFSISGNLSFCQGQTTTLTQIGDAGSFIWNTGATTASISVNNTSNYTVTVTNANACSSTRSVSTVVNPLPVANISGNASFCYGGNSVLTASSASTYAWSNTSGLIAGATSDTYNATQANTYTVTVTNSFACSATASRIITQNTSVLPNISGTTAICAGASTTLNAGSYNGYTWSDAGGTIAAASGQSNWSVASAGIYTVLVTDAAGCTGSNSIQITSNTNPTVSIGGAAAFCTGSNTNLSVPSGFSNIEWSNGFAGAANTSITVSSANTYLVTVTDANGCTATATRVVVENTLPQAAISGNTSFCQAQSTTLTASGGSSGTYNYLWSGTGAATNSINITATPPTTYTVTVTNSTSLCSATATSNVTVLSLPTPSITTNNGTNAFCNGSSIGLGLNSTGGLTAYQWSNAGGTIGGANAANYNTTTAGIYTVQVTNTDGCTANTSITISSNTNPTPSINGGASAAAYCQNNSVSLTASGGNTYAWSTGGSTAVISVGAINTYTVTVTNTATGCTASQTINVTQNTLPTATITGTAAYCVGKSTTLTANGAGAGGSYLWSTAATTAAISLSGTPASAYTVSITDANGCTASQTTSITLYTNPTASLSNNGAPQAAAFCIGKNITLNAPVGLSGYQWSNAGGVIAGQSNNTYTTNTAGTYTVRITNSNGCTGTSSLAIVQNNLPTASIAAPSAFCAGNSISLTANAGIGLGYAWSTGASVAGISISPSLSTTYTVTVTITATGCTQTAQQTVVQNALPTPIIGGTSFYCLGASTTLSASGGNTYAWSNGDTNSSVNISASPIGTSTYTVTATSADNCSASTTIAVTVNPTPTASITSTGGATAFCAGNSLSLTAPSGLTAYAWSNGNTASTILVNTAALYSVTITNAQNCTASANIIITENALPTANISVSGGINATPAVCAGNSISLSANTGAGLGYIWNTGANSSTINPTPSTNTIYTVTISNTATGCTQSATQNIVYNALPTPSISGTARYCLGGSSSLTANGGTGYVWSDGSTTNQISSTIATVGNTIYTVTVSDAATCTASTTISITIDALPNISITSAGAACANTSLTASSGLSNYVWSNPAVIAGATSNTYTPTTAGTYSVQAANALTACTATASILVNSLPTSSADINSGAATAAFCANGGTTSLCLPSTIFGNWSNGLTNTNCISVNTTGTYIVTVTNANGCTATDAITVNQNALPTPSISGAATTCGASSTSLTTGVFNTYTWSNSPSFATVLGSSQSLNVNTTSTYYVQVTNANACSNTASFVLTQFSNPSPTIVSSNGANICNGSTTSLTADAGYIAYQWADINGTIATATTNMYTATSAGIYTVTVTASGGCTGTQSFSLANAVLPEPGIAGANAFCTGSSVNLSVVGSIPPASTYLWSNGQNTASININTAGTYTLTVTTSANCTAVAQTTVIENTLPQASLSGNATFCAGGTGTSITASGGAFGSFDYSWSDGHTAAIYTINNLAISPTTYTVTVTNTVSNCSAIANIVVTQLVQPSTTLSATSSSSLANSFCAGSTATLTAASGLSSYTWQLNGNPIAGTNSTLIANTAGIYTITITNSQGCSNTASITLSQNSLPIVGINNGVNIGIISAAFCAGSNVNVTATGGTSYTWSNSTNTANNTINTATTYTVTATDANNCSNTASLLVNENALPAIAINGATAFCSGSATTLTASGGTAYSWTDGANSSIGNQASLSIGGTPINPYAVQVTNANGCSATATVSLTEQALPTPNLVSSTNSPDFCANGSITLSTGAGFANYQWYNGTTLLTSANNNTYTTSTAGTYSVVVTNINGCSNSTSIAITALPTPTASINGSASGASTAFCAGSSVAITASGGNAYAWSTGANTATTNVFNSGIYTVTITAINTCTQSASVNITQNNLPTPSISGIATYCVGSNTTLTASGGTAYDWGTGFGASPNLFINANTSGTYTVTVSDANNCTATQTVSINVNALPTPSITSSSPTMQFCAGSSLSLQTNAGLAPYTWSSTSGIILGANNNTYPATTAGVYTVQVTNNFGCTATTSTTIVANTLPTIGISGNLAFCVNNSTTLTANGGATYIWNNGTPSASLSITQGGTYSVTATDSNTCTATASTSVVANSRPTPSIVGNTVTCAGSNTILSLTNTYNTYTWSSNETTASINATGPQTYTVTVTDSNTCSNTASIFIGQNATPIPTLTSSSPLNIICGGSTATISTSNSFVAPYAWTSSNGSLSANGNSITVTQSGTYTVTVTNTQGCTGTSSITLTLAAPPAAAAVLTSSQTNGSFAFCANTNLVLSANGGSTVNYLWNSGATTPTLTVSNSGTHTVTVTDTNGCTASSSVSVTSNALPTPSLNSTSLTTCTNTTTTLSTNTTYSSYLWSYQNSTAASISVSTTNTYTVTVTDGNGCTGTTAASIVQSITPTPNIATTPTGTIVCTGSTLNLSANSGYQSYLWSLNNATTTSINVTQAGTYTVTVTTAQGCTASTTLVVTASAPPTAAAIITGNLSFCTNSSTVLQAGSAATYIWSAGGQSSPSINISTANTYTVTVSNAFGCTASTSVVVTQNTLPSANITSSNTTGGTSVCSNSNLTLTASGGNTYIWSNSSANPSISIAGSTPSAIYTVTVTDGNGCSNSLSRLVTVNQAPTTLISTNNGTFAFCQGANLTLDGGAGFITYQWSNTPATTTRTLNTNLSGTYTVTVSDGNGCTNSASTTIIERQNPTPSINTIPNTTTFCQGTSVNLIANGGYINYQWSGGQSGQSLNVAPSANTTYTVTVTDTNSCIGTASRTLTFSPTPIIAVQGASNGAASFCSGGGVSLTATGGATYVWSSPSAVGAILNVTAAGTYTVTVTTAQGCTASTAIVVTERATPTANITATNNLFVICSNTNINLQAPAGFAGYIWNNNSTAQSISTNIAGVYTVTVTAANNCTASSTRLVAASINPSPTISGANSFCTGGNTMLSANNGSTYTWSNGSSTAAITVSTSGIYTVTATNTAGCNGTNSINVSLAPNPTPTISGITALCNGTNASLDAGANYTTYTWSNGSTTIGTSQNLSIALSGTYFLTVTNTAGCSGTTSINIQSLVAPILSLSGTSNTPNFCTGRSTLLTATSGLNNYTWSNSSNTLNTLNANTGGIYTVTASNAQGCTASASIVVVENALPNIGINSVSAFCKGQSIILQSTGTSGTYQWSGGGSNAVKTISTGGVYTVTVTDSNGCKSTISTTIIENALPTAYAGADATVYPGATYQMNATGGNTYTWSQPTAGSGNLLSANNIGDPIATIVETQRYTVTVTDTNGCTASDELVLIVGDALDCLSLSEGLTPNGDGHNDTWSIGCLDYFDNTVQIFNRWGQLIYSVTNYKNNIDNWNGAYQGTPLPDGTYYYIITIKVKGKASDPIYKGTVTLLR